MPATRDASQAILSLQPVTFRYMHELDPSGIRQFGLVAEDMER
jgi:Chaperone of endosialidase